MKYCTITEISKKWEVSRTLVRRYIQQGRIPKVIQKDGVWLIPENAKKPDALNISIREDLSSLVKQIRYQRTKNNHFGIYEYIQVNLAYSSNRMASNRLTRLQVEEAYRTNKIATAFEPMKVDDIIETINHFATVRYIVDNISTPLSQSLIKKLHYTLTYGTYADRKDNLRPGEFRNKASKFGVPHSSISSALSDLLKDYEKGAVDMARILDFHVKFEQIHPFEDYNGRVGRLIMLKECLRHGVDPFIIDDKHRGAYNRGITAWSADREQLMSVSLDAQARFQSKMEVCKLFQYARFPEPYRGSKL